MRKPSLRPFYRRDGSRRSPRSVLKALWVFVLLYFFLVGIRSLSAGFKMLGSDVLHHFFEATSNPFVGLSIGLLATTLVQSSSVTTSMVVALVAAPVDPLPMANAIPMVMGANIGTTVTNTLVSVGHVGRPREFFRALSAATCHDFFNWFAVALLLPLELATGFLEKMSALLAGHAPVGVGGEMPNPVKGAANLIIDPLERALVSWIASPGIAASVFIVLAAAVIFLSLASLVRVLRTLTQSRLERYVNAALTGRPLTAMATGVISTAMVQSSSITTSTLVPFAGSGIVKLEQVFPIMLGANLGTTLTALIAALGAPEATVHLAVQIALVHLLFNLVGIAIIYSIPALRRIPLKLARWLAGVALRSKVAAVGYIVGLFYLVPGLLTLAWRFL